MNSDTVIRDLISRVEHSLSQLPPLDTGTLNAHPGGHPNSPAWLLWHTGREIDLQLAHLSGDDEVWGEFRGRVGLGDIGDTLGYGHSAAEARSVHVDDAAPLIDYLRAALTAASRYADTVTDWDAVVDTYEGQPVTRQVRVTSLLVDALEHLAQAAYVAGMPERVSDSAERR